VVNLVTKEEKKLNRVINFVKKGLAGLADELEGTVKAINDFTKSLQKAQKDLKDVSIDSEVMTISTSSKMVAAGPTEGVAKAAAANTLFSLLSGSEGTVQGAPQMTAAPTPPGGSSGGPPKAPGGGPPKAPGGGLPKAPGGGPPKAPGGGLPKAPGGGPPARGNLPPAPKLPPTSGGPPKAPGGSAPAAHVKRPTAPPAPPGGVGAPSVAPQAGGGLSSLRDEMLDELTRLKKIMRGES